MGCIKRRRILRRAQKGRRKLRSLRRVAPRFRRERIRKGWRRLLRIREVLS